MSLAKYTKNKTTLHRIECTNPKGEPYVRVSYGATEDDALDEAKRHLIWWGHPNVKVRYMGTIEF